MCGVGGGVVGGGGGGEGEYEIMLPEWGVQLILSGS